MTFSERFNCRYPGYILDSLMRVRPGPEVKTIQFKHLWDMLRSQDHTLIQQWMFSDIKDTRYLQKDAEITVETMGQIVSYCSYPRCGNSFLRKYLQNITGIATGSDMTLEFNQDLQLQDFKAEEITDSSVWIRKSHEPKPNQNNKLNKCNKILCCVRNPFDCTASLMHFLPTLNQGGQINENFSEVPEVWNKLVIEATDS